jgi:hypothetical protein
VKESKDVVGTLLERIKTMQLKEKQSEQWQTDLASDIEKVLGRTVFELETSGDESDILFAEAIIKICARVIDFEWLECVIPREVVILGTGSTEVSGDAFRGSLERAENQVKANGDTLLEMIPKLYDSDRVTEGDESE